MLRISPQDSSPRVRTEQQGRWFARFALLALLAAAPSVGVWEASAQGVDRLSSVAAAYVVRHPELAAQQRLEVHYETHAREAFWIRAAAYELRFRLGPDRPAVDMFRPAGLEASAVAQASLDVRFGPDGDAGYRTALARSPARMNIFRHGPHYYDVHVFDLQPTRADGDTLPVRVEVVFHAYPERIFTEVRLHPTTDAPVGEAEVVWRLPAGQVERYLAEGLPGADAAGRLFTGEEPLPGATLGAALAGGAMFGLVVGAPDGTRALGLEEREAQVLIRQACDTSYRDEAGRAAVYARLVAAGPGGLRVARGEETHPLPDSLVVVGEGAVWGGYDARRGYYDLATESGRSVSWYYENPDYVARAPFAVVNDERPRKLYVRHADAAGTDRLGAGVVTDALGLALPVLVQGSKNFSGEHEEPFYDPGDASYSEAYFPLVLDPRERIVLWSNLAFQNWGNHPLKQVSSLQAWMPYYQMSVGVTETTCYVPFRFGGHEGIWVADLRGLSGEMWTTQPQFDNVGGHRFFHYTTDGEAHHPRYLRSRFRMTGPNMAWWGMEYRSDDDAARLLLDAFEFPQTDQTRHFVRLRVDVQDSLTIRKPLENLHLVSIDTRTQRLRYGRAGYLAPGDSLVEWEIGADAGPVAGVLSRAEPVFGLYDVSAESPQAGNNAVLVRRFIGRASGRPLTDLAVRLVPLGGGDVRLSLTLPDSVLRFVPGDYLEVDLMLLPYGTVGADFSPPLEERVRYGREAPRVAVRGGRPAGAFPSVVRVAREGATEFTVSGGYGVIPVLVEGFVTHVPPLLQRKGRLGWQTVEMTAGGNAGHHTYLADDGTFGFVFLTETDGRPVPFRVFAGRR